MSRVHFKKGNLEEFNSITKDPNTIYFVDGGNSGTGHQIYLGDVPYYTAANFFTNSGKDGDMPVHYKKGDVWFVKDSIPELDENGEQITDSDGNIVMKEVAFIKFCINDYIEQYKDNDWQQLSLNGTSATIQELDWNPSSTYYKTGISNNAVVTGKPGKTSEVIYNGNQDTILGFKEIFNDIINNTATGDYSHAEGTHTDATGVAAHAEGKGAIASGDNSHAEGEHTNSSGNDSHSEGNHTKAIGFSSHAEGNNTAAIGDYSHAEGRSANIVPETITQDSTENEIIEAWNNSETVEGYFSLASGDNSHVEGKDCLTIGDNSHAEGIFTKAIGNASHSQGQETEAIGDRSFASGQETKAVGEESHAEGYSTTANGNFSHAEGKNTEAHGDSSHAEGEGTEANIVASHAEGYNTLARERYSHAEGDNTKALGEAAHSEGKDTVANSSYAHVEGYSTYAGANNDIQKDEETIKFTYEPLGLKLFINTYQYGGVLPENPKENEAISFWIIFDSANYQMENCLAPYCVSKEDDKTFCTYAYKDPETGQYIDFYFGRGSINEYRSGKWTAGGLPGYIKAIGQHLQLVSAYDNLRKLCKKTEDNEFHNEFELYYKKPENFLGTTHTNKPVIDSKYKFYKFKASSYVKGANIKDYYPAGLNSNFQDGTVISFKNEPDLIASDQRPIISLLPGHLYKINNYYFSVPFEVNIDNKAIWYENNKSALWTVPFFPYLSDSIKFSDTDLNRLLEEIVPIDSSSTIPGISDDTDFPKAFGSHAEGMNTKVYGIGGHVEGIGNIAAATASHASGYGNKSVQNGQMVVGRYSNTNNSGLFIVGNGSGETARKNAFRVENDGTIHYETGYTNNADYAEYFEWKDKNLENEDRRGLFVRLDGEKIVKANKTNTDILGIVSSAPSVVGDAQSEEWKGKYEKDLFGSIIKELGKDEMTGEEILIPKVNPDYNPDEIYIPRSERPEWSPVGMVGKLIVVDDGTCEVNGYCGPGDNGIATRVSEPTNCRVMARIDENHIKVLLK